MTPDQIRLAAIRARISGVWDHPALLHFGKPACQPSIRWSIEFILDGELSLADAALIEQEMEPLT